MDERPQPQRGRSSMRLLVTAAPRACRTWWAWRTRFALWSTWCTKRRQREHPHSKKHNHLLHSSTSFLIQLLKANIAASVLSKFEALSDAISVAAHSLVAPCIHEIAQESFSQRSCLITESIVNPFTLLARARDPRVSEQRQMSGERRLRGFECIAKFTHAQLALAQRGDYP